MSRKNEDSIEKFFRKGLRQSDTTFRESDWLDLEKRLDEEAQLRAAARAKSFRRTFTAGSGILLIAVSLYFFMPNGGEIQSTVHGPQSTADNAQSAVHSPPSYAEASAGKQSTADNTKSTTDNEKTAADGLSANTEALADTQSAVHNAQSTDRDAQQMDTQTQRSNNRVQPAGSDPTTTSGKETLKDKGRAETAPTDESTAVRQTDALQKSSTENTRLTRKPRQPERSGAPAISKPVTPTPTVATASERSGHVSRPAKTDKQNTATAHPPVATAESALSAQHAPVSITEEDRSVKGQSTTPAVVTAASTPDQRVLAKEEDTSSSDQTATSIGAMIAPTVSDREANRPTISQPTTAEEASAIVKESSATSKQASRTDTVSTTAGREIGASSGLLARRSFSEGGSTDSTSTDNTLQKDTTIQKEPKAEKRIRSRWNAALVVAPDFSSTGFGGEMSAPGQAFGGLIGFRISRKFTVTSGVIRSTKKYEGYGKDYTPPAGYWQRRTNGVVPDEIQGSCTVVEVPITVQYDVRQSTRSRLYISAGVSSYFMRHEEYDYRFNEPNDGADRRWSSNAHTTYAFKVGHLSAAYEIMLNKNLGVGVEPYIKIPFQGIGWPNISLYTTGAYINVRYFLLRKNVE